jgi:zinc protease
MTRRTMSRRTMLAAAASAALFGDRKNRAPVSHEVLRAKIPEAHPVKLSNGLTLLAIEDPRVPLAWLRIQVDGAGKIYQTRPGLAQATAEMLRQGTRNRSGTQISEEAAQLGATLAGGTNSNRETGTIDGSGLSSRFEGWLALAADILINPAFPGDEFTTWRQRRIADSRIAASRLVSVAADRLMALSYGSHPAGLPEPSAGELAALTPEMLAGWHRQRYTPGNTVLSIIGRVRASDIASASEKLFGTWKTPESKVELPPEPQSGGKRRIVLIDRPGAPQTDVCIGGLLFERRHQDYFAMAVLNALLGGGNISRLDFALQRKVHVLNVLSEIGTARYTGSWRVRLSVGTDSTDEAINVVLSELQRLCDAPATSTELEDAKASESGHFALDLEQPSRVINYSYQRYRYGFSNDYWERYPAKVDAVTAAEVQSVAQKYYRPEAAHIVAVGDAAKLRNGLAKLGPIEG